MTMTMTAADEKRTGQRRKAAPRRPPAAASAGQPPGATPKPASGAGEERAEGRRSEQEMARKIDVVRTTVKVTVDLDMRIRHEAARRGMTLSEWTREALEAHLPGISELPVRRHLLAAGSGDSGRSDISERIEEFLYGRGDLDE